MTRIGTYTIGHGDHAAAIPAQADEFGNVCARASADRLQGWFECRQGDVLGKLEDFGGDIAETWEDNSGKARFWPESAPPRDFSAPALPVPSAEERELAQRTVSQIEAYSLPVCWPLSLAEVNALAAWALAELAARESPAT